MNALSALRDFHGWLVNNREDMTAPNGVGKEALDWFVKYGLLLPYTSEENGRAVPARVGSYVGILCPWNDIAIVNFRN